MTTMPFDESDAARVAPLDLVKPIHRLALVRWVDETQSEYRWRTRAKFNSSLGAPWYALKLTDASASSFYRLWKSQEVELDGHVLPADIGNALSRSDIPRDRGKCRFLAAACTQGSRIVETSELFGQGSTEVVAREATDKQFAVRHRMTYLAGQNWATPTSFSTFENFDHTSKRDLAWFTRHAPSPEAAWYLEDLMYGASRGPFTPPVDTEPAVPEGSLASE